MTKEKATSPEKKAALEAIRAEFKGTDSHAQRARLMAAFKLCGSFTTYEARRYLDVYYPPARIIELRQSGERIETHWQWVKTEAGDLHRLGLYVRASGVNHETSH